MVCVPLGPQRYRGENSAAKFLEQLEAVSPAVKKKNMHIVTFSLTPLEKVVFQEGMECYFVKVPSSKWSTKCVIIVTSQDNLKDKQISFVIMQNDTLYPYILHNLSGYDSRFIVRELSNFPC
jgi:hypothetical protein